MRSGRINRSSRLFVPERTVTRTLVAFVILWISWFLYQVYTVGKAASDEVASRFLDVSSNAQIFAVKQFEALRVLWATLENVGRLLAPFLVDVAIVLRDVYCALPVEAQLGLVGLSVATYALVYSRLVRHMIFLPVAVAMWFILPQVPSYIARILLSLVDLVIPVIGSLISFHQKQLENCGFWISYWFLFPIMKILLKVFIMYIPRTTSSGGIYWRMQCIWCTWLVLWGGSDLAFGFCIRVFDKVWAWTSRRGIVTTIVQVVFSWKSKADSFRAPSVQNTWRLQEKLGKFSSLGMHTLALVGLACLLIVLFMYKLLSVVSTAIVWPWFLYELGSAAHRKMSQLYRGKIALALLFLLCDWMFRQQWFVVPNFILDFIRIPLILALNMFGEMILETLLSFISSCSLETILGDSPKDDRTLDDIAPLHVDTASASTDHATTQMTDDATTPAGRTALGSTDASAGIRRRVAERPVDDADLDMDSWCRINPTEVKKADEQVSGRQTGPAND